MLSTRWPDGYEHEVAALTKEQWESQEALKSTGFWTSEDKTLSVREKADRKPLIWLRQKLPGKQAKQICMIQVKKFLEQRHAVELVIQLGKEVERQATTIDHIYARREEVFQEYCDKHGPQGKDRKEERCEFLRFGLHWGVMAHLDTILY